MYDGMYSRTAAELVELHNARCAPGDRIRGPWKASKRELIGRIRALGDPAADDLAPEAAEGACATAEGTVGALVRRLLVTDAPYRRIVEEARRRFPDARTTSRSVASLASGLRREGVAVPMRRAKRRATS